MLLTAPKVPDPSASDLTTRRSTLAGSTVTVSVSEAVGGVTPAGGVPVPLTVLVSALPESISSCVTVYVAVRVTSSPGAMLPVFPPPEMVSDCAPDALTCVSVRATFDKVTLPVFVTL